MTSIAQPPAAKAGPKPTAERVNHWINGRRVAGISGRSGPVYNPATGELAREVDFASVEEVDAAVAAAKAAFPKWRATSISKRTEILFRIRNLVEEHKRRDRRAPDPRARQGADPTPSARCPAASRTSSSRPASRIC